MRNLFLALGFATLSTAASAQMVMTTPPVSEAQTERYQQVCSSWSYNSTVNGYVCSYTSYEDVLDSWELQQMQQTITQLQRQVQDLEYRVQRLEMP